MIVMLCNYLIVFAIGILMAVGQNLDVPHPTENLAVSSALNSTPTTVEPELSNTGQIITTSTMPTTLHPYTFVAAVAKDQQNINSTEYSGKNANYNNTVPSETKAVPNTSHYAVEQPELNSANETDGRPESTTTSAVPQQMQNEAASVPPQFQIESNVKANSTSPPIQTEGTPDKSQIQTEATSDAPAVLTEAAPDKSQILTKATSHESHSLTEATPDAAAILIEGTADKALIQTETTSDASQIQTEAISDVPTLLMEATPYKTQTTSHESQILTEATSVKSEIQTEATTNRTDAFATTVPPHLNATKRSNLHSTDTLQNDIVNSKDNMNLNVEYRSSTTWYYVTLILFVCAASGAVSMWMRKKWLSRSHRPVRASISYSRINAEEVVLL